MDHGRRQVFGGGDGPVDDGVESDVPGVGDTGLDGVEGAAVEQVGEVHGVTGRRQFAGEGANAVGESLGVVEQDDLGHGRSFDE